MLVQTSDSEPDDVGNVPRGSGNGHMSYIDGVVPATTPGTPKPDKRRMWRRARVVGPVAFLAGLGFGSSGDDPPQSVRTVAAAPTQGPTTAPESGHDDRDEHGDDNEDQD
jgi:hypothetical protein